MQVRTIGILGAGAMGSGIAQVSAIAGLSVALIDVDAGIAAPPTLDAQSGQVVLD